MKNARYILVVLLVMVSLAGCRRGHEAVPGAERAVVYFWRTSLSLDSAERDFLSTYGVKKMYVRMFDVVLRGGKPMPNATITGLDSVPGGIAVVPTVFIMENCLSADTSSLAENLVSRVAQMCETHGVEAHELQIDCDWTVKSMKTFYALLADIRRRTERMGWTLSATIRLHQLSMPVPPVDYGVLMMYNTGDMRIKDGTNPILDAKHVAPYLKYLKDYDLPLCAAWPCFEWKLLYAGGEFKAILYSAMLDDTTRYRRVAPDRYVVVRRHDAPEYNSDLSAMSWIDVGDTIVVAHPGEDVILGTQAKVIELRPEMSVQTILYSLNSEQMKLYNTDFYEKIFNP